jgi:hypothetical protein
MHAIVVEFTTLVVDGKRCVPTKIWTYRANLRRDPCRNCVTSAGKWREISAFTGLHRGATCSCKSLNRTCGEVFQSDCVSLAPFRFPSVLLQPLGHLSVCLESVVYRLMAEPANPNCVANCVRPLNLSRSLTANKSVSRLKGQRRFCPPFQYSRRHVGQGRTMRARSRGAAPRALKEPR